MNNTLEWLSNLTPGDTVYEITSKGQTLVRISEVKKGRIWYSPMENTADLRYVRGDTGSSHDLSRHILPKEPDEVDDDDDDDDYTNALCMPLKSGAITTI